MFSSQTNWQLQPNRLSQLLEEKKKAGERILDLTVSNPLQSNIEYPVELLLAALGKPESLSYAPEPRGLLSAREAVARYYAAKQIQVDPIQIVLTASTSEAYSFLFTLLCEAGENILVPAPSYPLFEHLARLNHVNTHSYKLRYDGEWHIDIDSLGRALTSATKAIVVVSPHNPTGMFLKNEELEALNEACARHKLALIVDEVFVDYGFDDDSRRVRCTAANSPPLTFTLNGISKLCGLPQLKLGWIVVSGEEGVRSEALQRLEMIADTFLSVNTPVQSALPELLAASVLVRSQILTRVHQNYQFLMHALRIDSPLSLLHVEGGWSAVVRVPKTKSEEEWALWLLQESGVHVFPGYFFEFPTDGHLVLSLLTEPCVFRKGVQEMQRLIR